MFAYENKSLNKKSKIPSFLFAFWLCIPAINDIATSFLSSSIMIVLYIGIFALLLAYLFLSTKAKLFFINIKCLLLCLIIIFCYVLSYIKGVTDLGPQYFAVYFAIPMLLFPILFYGNYFDLKLLLLYISIIPSIGIFFAKKVFQPDANSVVSMGTSYNFLTPILACLVFAVLFLKFQSKKFKIFYCFIIIINLIYFYQILKYGSRGPIVCIVAFIFLAFIFKYDKNQKIFRFKKGRFFLVLAVCLLAIVFFEPILLFLNSIIDSTMIRKMVLLLQNNDISNGRIGIYKNALLLFLDKPIFGHGISSFKYYTGESYPHNVVLQMLFDNGIILTIIMLIPIIRFFITGRKKVEYNEFVFILYLFSTSFVKALLSGNIWESDKLWIFLALCIVFNARKTIQGEKI